MPKLAQAAIAENGSIYGVPGNQKRTAGKLDGEMDIREVYAGFTKIFRLKDRGRIDELCAFAVECVKNPRIGYSQGTAGYGENGLRTGLIYQCRKHHWLPAAIDEACNCDCSSFVMTCLHKIDIDVPETMYTGNQREILRATGLFDEIDIKKDQQYIKGDILWKSGHTAIVVEEDAEPEGQKMIVSDCKSVYMREKYGVQSSETVTTLFAGDVVYATGETVVWYKCKDRSGREGWVSGKYLRKA